MSVPKKVAVLLDQAINGGLDIVNPKSEPDGRRSWTIASPLLHEPRELWIFWLPGSHGGRMTPVRYDPYRGKRSSTESLTVRKARYFLDALSEDVARAEERRAKRG